MRIFEVSIIKDLNGEASDLDNHTKICSIKVVPDFGRPITNIKFFFKVLRLDKSLMS